MAPRCNLKSTLSSRSTFPCDATPNEAVTASTGGKENVLVQRHWQDVATVIVGVFADEVNAARSPVLKWMPAD